MATPLLKAIPVSEFAEKAEAPAKASGMDLVKKQVMVALSQPGPPSGIAERRRMKRHPYPYPLYLTPVGQDGVTPAGKTIPVVGKHLSECGLDFYCTQPLPHRRMIVSLPASDGKWSGVIIDLTWCRFSQHGWYDNGGRFLMAVESPMNQPGVELTAG